MQIIEVVVKNFRSFQHEHAVNLSTTEKANLVVVYGENMRGKTTLLQAITWGLYGEARDRDNTPILILDPTEKEQLLSTDAASDGDYSMSVLIRFEHEGQPYLLRRTVESQEKEPSTDDDFVREAELSRDGHQVSAALVEPTIQSILSRDVARFFLFDGEMLADYEHLLKSPDHEATTVKDSIEKILGLPALYASKDLAQLASVVEKKQNTQLRKLKKHHDLVEEAAKLDNAAKALKQDLSLLEKDLQNTREEAEKAQLAVLQMGNVEKDIREKNLLEKQIDQESTKLAENQDAIRHLLAETWWIPVAGVVDRRVADLQEQLVVASEGQEQLRRIRDIQRSLEQGSCDLCGTKLADHQRDELRKHVTQMKLDNIDVDMDADEASLSDMYRRLRTYERFRAPEAVTELTMRERNIQEATLGIADCESHIADIGSRISNRAFGDMQDKTDRWQQLSKRSADLQRAVQETSKQLAQAEAQHQSTQRKLSSLPEADRSLGLEALAYRELEDLFTSVVDDFREGLRAAVGHDASEFFRRLTTEEAYTGLEINKHFGLSLLDSNGNPVPGRSAGAEQIVALSLIGGLNRAAVREGPVVMDTNLGRLDQGHRENVLRFLPQLGRQVVILVHSGELSKDEELSELGLKVARRYEIRRLSETRSEIVELS